MVKEVYEQVTQREISSIVLTGIGGQGKSTLAALVFNYVEQQRSDGKGIFRDAALWFDVGQDTSLVGGGVDPCGRPCWGDAPWPKECSFAISGF